MCYAIQTTRNAQPKRATKFAAASTSEQMLPPAHRVADVTKRVLTPTQKLTSAATAAASLPARSLQRCRCSYCACSTFQYVAKWISGGCSGAGQRVPNSLPLSSSLNRSAADVGNSWWDGPPAKMHLPPLTHSYQHCPETSPTSGPIQPCSDRRLRHQRKDHQAIRLSAQQQ